MKRNIAIIMIITVFTKLIGFGREIALTYFFGASATSDVYLIAQTIPTTIFALVGTGLATTFIPIYHKVQKENGEEEAHRFSSNIMNSVVILSVLIIVLVLVFTPQVVMLFASGFTGETMEMAIRFTRISIFGIAFSGMIYILNAYLQLKDNFTIPALISLPMNMVIIFSFYLADQLNDVILAYGLVASVLIQLIFILPSVIRNRFHYKMVLDAKDVYLKEMMILAVPIIIGTSVNQLNVLVDKNIASNVAVGGISALNYANRLNTFIQGLFVAPVVTVIYPSLSKQVLSRDFSGLKKVINESIVYISLLIIPATVGAMVLARPIIDLLFLRGQFDEAAAEMTAQALFFYALGMIAFGLREVFSRVFYAYKDTKTPTYNAMIGVSLNIVLNLILSRFLGIGGLALGTSISAAVTTYLLVRSLRKKMVHFGLRDTMRKIVKITFASLVMGAAAYGLMEILSSQMSSNLSLTISILLSGALYFVLILSLRIDEVRNVMRLFREKLHF
ncbi:murein biosynthesis integral membrane protein MurJ [Proteiniclasticum sp. SCR006]|uniref:Probable lipid II flippase MurJ n=1 Tax=Proteiniclasticum aestuarii TaxID=2817862 RepID=A0A939HAQ8_9CLOT|nr:murein biosynthesis integral membrane protein MurJ [Proteiniclasticum aestuarii]MBO1266316.1 murein biosynthesis integral membrane protein MurJ [Proteiniclasticum aestuarii]